MDIIRKETDYAFRCLVRLSDLKEGELESVREVAAAESLPEPVLRKILQRLGKSGIVASTKGRSGGVRLARPPHQITLLDVLESVQGTVTLNRCVRPEGCCENMGTCRLHTCIKQAQHKIDNILNETTLQEFLEG